MIDEAKMPIWLAYVLAPAFMLFVAGKIILRSENSVLLAAIAYGIGMLCAATLHAYTAITAVHARVATGKRGQALGPRGFAGKLRLD